MTEQQARTTANVIMIGALLGAAVAIVRSPALRRLTWNLARRYAAGPVALYLATSVREAWLESGRAEHSVR